MKWAISVIRSFIANSKWAPLQFYRLKGVCRSRARRLALFNKVRCTYFVSPDLISGSPGGGRGRGYVDPRWGRFIEPRVSQLAAGDHEAGPFGSRQAWQVGAI